MKVFFKSSRKLFQEIFVHGLQLLETEVFQTDRPTFYNACDIIFFNVESQDFDEFKHLCIQLLIKDFEMSWLYVHWVFVSFNFGKSIFFFSVLLVDW